MGLIVEISPVPLIFSLGVVFRKDSIILYKIFTNVQKVIGRFVVVLTIAWKKKMKESNFFFVGGPKPSTSGLKTT